MADFIVITGVKPYDGRYEMAFDGELTTREWGWIKRHAGYLPATMGDDAFSDPELVCALAVITLHRAGKVEPRDVASLFDRLADAPFGSTITLEIEPTVDEEEDDAGPPPTSSSGSNGFSGPGSTTSSETSAPTPGRSGIPASDISAFDPTTLLT